MSDDKNLKDDLDDMLGDAKESAKEFAKEAKETFNTASGDNKKILAGVLAILLGYLGVHKIYFRV